MDDPHPGGRGILNMRARAETLEAEFSVEAGNPGTRILLRVPIPVNSAG